jgi:hypothetical protein
VLGGWNFTHKSLTACRGLPAWNILLGPSNIQATQPRRCSRHVNQKWQQEIINLLQPFIGRIRSDREAMSFVH